MPYTLLLQRTGCDDPKTAHRVHKSPKSSLSTDSRLECLRELEYDVLLNATLKVLGTLPFSRQVSTWGPSYKSGSLIDVRPSERLDDGHFLKIPMLIGTNKDEGKISITTSRPLFYVKQQFTFCFL
jgi:carboxylesterase type B